MTVVSVPLPAITGNAMGTTAPAFGLLSPLKNSKPNTISKPSMNNTIEPATAKEAISNPIKFNTLSPIKKKRIISKPETKVARKALMPPILFRNEMSIGMEPSISITANKAKVQVSISRKESEVRGMEIILVKILGMAYNA